ncbi:YadA-like family protein, partial [Ursidibacter maritimus]
DGAKTELQGNIDNVKNELTTKGMDYKGENGELIHKALGEQLDIIGDSKNVSTTNEGGKIKITMSDTPTFTNLTTTEGATIGGKLDVTGPAIFADKVTANKGLDVNGATTLNGTVAVKDKLTAEKGLEVTGTTTLNNGATIKGGDLVMSGNKITGLADGVDTKDAVNVGQLDNKVNDAKTELKGDIDTAKTELNTKIDDTKTELNNKIDGAKTELQGNIDNVKNELTTKGMDYKGENGEVIHKSLGEQLDIIGDSKNVSTTNEGGKIKIMMSDTPTFTNLTTTEGATIGGKLDVTGPATFNDKVTANNGLEVTGTTTFNNGATIKGGDLVMSDNKITGLADGVDTKDAVNVGQLDNKVNDAKTELKGDIDTAKTELNNKIDDTKTELNNKIDGAKTELQGNIDNVKNELTTKGMDYKGENGEVIHKALGEQLDITGANNNIKTTSSAAEGVKIELNNTLNLTDAGSVNFGDGNAKLTKEGLTAGDVSVTKDGINAGNKAITNVKAGENDTDAVNLAQLNATKAIAEKGWNVTIAKGEGEATAPTTPSKVAPGETLTYTAGKNVKLAMDGKNITIATTENATFTNVNATKVDATDVNTTNITSTGKAVIKDLNVSGDSTLGNVTIGGQDKVFNITSGTKVDMGGNTINNITSGEIKAGDNNAVTGDVVNTKIQELTDSGMKFAGNNGTVITTKLGDQLNIIGGNVTAGSYSSNNVRTQTDGTGNVTIEFADKPVFNGLDVSNQKITSVLDGDISPNSTDAVNGRQIFALTGGQGAPNVVANYTTTITNPDGSKTTLNHTNVVVDENGKPLLVTYNVQDQKEHVTNSVITAINNMNTQGIKFFHTNDGTAKAERPADQSENNEDSSASGAYATAVGYRATASGERAIAFGHNSTVTGTDSISVGTGNTVSGNNSGAFGDPSIIDADKSYSVGNDNRIAQGQSDVFVLGNSVTNTASNSVFLGTQSGYVAEGETTKGNSAHTSQTIGGETYQYAGGEANQVKGVVSVGNVAQDGTMETRRIQNVAPGLVSETSTDAINGSQLYSLHSVVDKGWNLTSGTVEGSNGVSNQSAPAKVGMGNTVRVNAGQNIVVNQNGRTLDIATTMAPSFNSLKINPNGKVDMGGNRIQNVGQAINAGDAVNYGQFKAELGKVDNRLRSGIAGAVASASLVQAFNPSESILAVGGGTYRGASALAVGYSKVSDNGKIIIKLTGSANNQGDYTGGASVGFKF